MGNCYIYCRGCISATREKEKGRGEKGEGQEDGGGILETAAQ